MEVGTGRIAHALPPGLRLNGSAAVHHAQIMLGMLIEILGVDVVAVRRGRARPGGELGMLALPHLLRGFAVAPGVAWPTTSVVAPASLTPRRGMFHLMQTMTHGAVLSLSRVREDGRRRSHAEQPMPTPREAALAQMRDRVTPIAKRWCSCICGRFARRSTHSETARRT